MECALWGKAWFEDVSPDAKLLYLFLATGLSTTPIGATMLTPRTIAGSLGHSKEDVLAALEELAPRVVHFPEHQVIWLRGFYDHQRGDSDKNWKFAKAAQSALADLPAEVQRVILKQYPELQGELNPGKRQQAEQQPELPDLGGKGHNISPLDGNDNDTPPMPHQSGIDTPSHAPSDAPPPIRSSKQEQEQEQHTGSGAAAASRRAIDGAPSAASVSEPVPTLDPLAAAALADELESLQVKPKTATGLVAEFSAERIRGNIALCQRRGNLNPGFVVEAIRGDYASEPASPEEAASPQQSERAAKAERERQERNRLALERNGKQHRGRMAEIDQRNAEREKSRAGPGETASRDGPEEMAA